MSKNLVKINLVVIVVVIIQFVSDLLVDKVFFQKLFRTSLGPPKHVLHLVWSDSDIITAINIALKLARLGQFMAIIGNYRSHYKSRK